MANTEKQGAMVLHEEGMTAHTLAPPPTSAPSLFVVFKQVHPDDGVKDMGSLLAIREANNMMKPTISSAATGIHLTPSTSLSDTTTHPANMPPDARCKGVTVTLDNNSMWNEFCKCKTEMILTKQGRRMFPYCRFRLSGIEPFQSYLLAMDIVPVDNHRYRWNGKGWETNGKADPHVSRLFVHPESPATGLHWMQYPVSFYRLKLCNNTLDQEGHIILHSMHRYLPRLHIIPADKITEDIQVDRPDVTTLSFCQTEFFAVTAYQNLCITQLKIDYNPFAKGFREDAVNARSTKAKNGVSIEEAEKELKLSKETTTLNNLKSLFMKRSAVAKVNKDQSVPNQTNGEKIVVNGDAPVVDRDKSTKKRPLPGAFSDFLKGAHVKVKRLSLDNMQKNCVVLQSATACTSGKQEAVAISSKPENVLQVGETVMGEIHPCKNTETCLKTELIKIDDNKMVIDEHKDDKNALLSGDQKVQISDEKGKENLSSTDTEAKLESKMKKILPHKRPEPVPLPLLAQFLKQRKSKTRSTTPKPEAPSVDLDSKPHLTSGSSSDLMSSTPSVNTHTDSQPSLTSLAQTVVASSTVDANNMTSSFSLIKEPFVLVETQKTLGVSPSLIYNTTSPTKLNFAPALDSLSDLGQDLDGYGDLRYQSDISSVFPCNDTDSSTTPTVSTDVPIAPDTPTDTTSYPVFDAPSSKNSEVIPNQELSPRPQVNDSESVSDCILESSNSLCPELFPHSMSIHHDSLSLPLDDPSSPAFSLPSPAPSSPDPFPPNLFCDRPVPPRKTLDSFPERLLDCTHFPSTDLFTIGLFGDMPEQPIHPLEGGILCGPIDLLVQNKSDFSGESVDLFSPRQSSDKPDSVNDIQSTAKCETTVFDHIVPEPTKQSSHGSTLEKSNKNLKKIGKLKHSEDDEVFKGPVPAPMQPSMEDVEGQLFVSFTSKTALEIHLGDDAKIEVPQKTLEYSDGDNSGNTKIGVLEKELLHDLTIMKHRQVIHPVLQEVGLKLNLLDHTLAIDLHYLGVQLPIPPSVPIPEGSSTSSQGQFISRTGKTSDITKIKGWRDKFAGSRSLSEGGSSIDTGQNNLSAFCSDMLDEYLASEGKLIDERAANLSQTDTTTVAYQLPTKSTSYVRTLDSVLKKQVPPSLSTTSKQPPPMSTKVKPTLKSKVSEKSKRDLKRLKSATGKQGLRTTDTVDRGDKFALSLKKTQQSKTCNIRKRSMSLGAEKLIVETPSAVVFEKTLSVEVCGFTSVSVPGGRGPGLPKTLMKLMDVEDGAVWEGKRRTCITDERAAIALTALVTAEGVTKKNADAMRIIKRRAPPCLNVFCRLGCVCASLLHLRRHHHCGKPDCMLGCSCLRRKVVALKSPKREESTTEDREPQGLSEEDKAKWKKNKKRKTYILTDPKATPEPAKRVSTLWDPKRGDCDSEVIFCPPLPRVPTPPLLTNELQHDLENLFSPPKKTRVAERGLSRIEESNNADGSQTCSRIRPFHWRSRDKAKTPVDSHPISQVSTEDIEEGELVPSNLSGPIKRLEIISECSWSGIESRNYIMQVVCEHMAQDRLKNPFWVGKYYIQPLSKSIEETEEGSVQTYKVYISQPVEKKIEDENVVQNEVQTESKQPVDKIEVKGLPFLSRCPPPGAGMLKAEIKAPDAPGQIMVNGKPYPQAKLELGKMGALHPANRLAAYITGRICPVSQSGSNAITTAITAGVSTTVPVTSVATVTAVTSTSASTSTSPIKTGVTTPSVGQDFTKFVVNHINSQNRPSANTSPLQSPPPKIVIPTSLVPSEVPSVSVKTGPVSKSSDCISSVSFPAASKVSVLNKPASVPLGGSNVTPTPVSSPGSSTKKTILITVVSRSTAVTSSSPQVEKPFTQVSPPLVTGQKMMLQVVKTADGNTLYRNPSGQLVRLVPLSQIKSMNPNVLAKGPTTMFRLPAPNALSLNKPKSNGTTTVTSSNPTSLTQAKSTITSPTHYSGKPVTLTTSKNVSFSNLPSTIKVSPSFLGQSGTCTLRILPPNAVKDGGTSSPSLSKPGFTLLKPISSTSQKSETSVSVSSDPKEGSVSQVLDLSKQSEVVPAKQNSCDDNKMSEHLAATASPKPTQCFEDASRPPDRELKPSGPSVKETDQEDGGNSSDLTDDSDLYSEDDQDDTYSDSGEEEHKPVENEDAEMKDQADVLVDIETFEESAERINIALLRESAKRESLLQSKQDIDDDDKKIKKVQQERMRRNTLREHFLKLHLVLKERSKNGSRMSILTLAQEEIKSLIRKEGKLVKKKDKLNIERDCYMQILSMLSDKSVESISQKLNEIITKQKAVEAQSIARQMSSQLLQTTPKPDNSPKLTDPEPKDSVLENVVNDALKLTQSPSKPIDLSLKKQRSLETSESVIEVKSTSKPKEPDGSKNTSTAPVKETSSVSVQPVAYTTHLNSVPITIPLTHSPIPRERMRPNILSRSQTVPVSPVKEPLVTNVCIPQVIPLVNTMGQIITLNNPLQPIDITSIGQQQSTTPGVASVSVSVPTMSGVENSLNTQVEPVNLSNIANVISLVPPVNNLVLPQQVVLEQLESTSAVDTQNTFIPASVEYHQKPQPREEEREAVEIQPDVPKQSVDDVPTTSVASSNQDALDKIHEDSSDPEDENLLSLLDELVLLSQQLNNDSPEPSNEEQIVTAPSEVRSQPDPQVNTDQDDDRELGPLFLTLDEDLVSPQCSKEIDDIPPKVDDLVKVIFGSDSPSVSSESAVATSSDVQSPQPSTSDALTPPPLLHMKATGGSVSGHPASEGANVVWRPMPKLVPLGLKALKSDSDVQDVQKPHT